jgi:hypothetical protein
MTTASVCSFSPAMATTIEVAKAADAAGLYAVWTGEFNDRSHWGAKQSGLIATRLLNPAGRSSTPLTAPGRGFGDRLAVNVNVLPRPFDTERPQNARSMTDTSSRPVRCSPRANGTKRRKLRRPHHVKMARTAHRLTHDAVLEIGQQAAPDAATRAPLGHGNVS